jgi:O-antigen/teichoic acid export membrane protein
MIDATAVGLYDAAVKLSEFWSFIPGTIMAAVYPAIVNARKNSEDSYNRRLGYLGIGLIILPLCIALPVTLTAPHIVGLVYGPQFSGAIPVLSIYIWANIGTFLGILVSQYLFTENQKKVLMFVAFVPMALNVYLNTIWIPEYGIVGAAYATLISYTAIPLSVLLYKEPRSRFKAVCRALGKAFTQA